MISIIIPVYNLEPYIEKCLESILNQDYQDFEIVLVDDGSSDNSAQVADRYLKERFKNYRIIKRKNGGVSNARNEGLKKAKGDYVVFVDGDDYLAKDFLSSLYNCLVEYDGQLSFCGYKYVKNQEAPVDDNDKIIVYNNQELLKSFLRRDIIFVLPSMMMKKNFLLDNNLFLNEAIRFSEDQMYIWDVFFKCDKAIYLPAKKYGYYLRENSTMTASPYRKIVNGVEEYDKYVKGLKDKYPNKKDIIDLILPRWQLGVLYSSARLLNREEFDSLYELVDGKSILKRIKGINEIKAYLLAIVSSASKGLLYRLCNRMDLNG